MFRVFVCARLGDPNSENVVSNIDRAITIGRQVWEKEGKIPVVPHLQALVMDDHDPEARQAGMAHALDLLLHCQELRFYDEPTAGMAVEMEQAERLGIPVEDYRCEPGGCYAD